MEKEKKKKKKEILVKFQCSKEMYAATNKMNGISIIASRVITLQVAPFLFHFIRHHVLARNGKNLRESNL